MRGLDADSDWTHLLPGMIVAGIGAGLVNMPLASTAVGVVEPARAGMASGINSTFRQVGIATGVAALGTILASHRCDSSSTRSAARRSPDPRTRLAHPISTGGARQAIASTPAPLRGRRRRPRADRARQRPQHVMLTAAIVAFAAGVASFLLIRERDFVETTDERDDEPAELALAA